MEQIQQHRKQIIITSLVVIILLIGGFFAYDNLVFRLKSTSPDASEVATSASFIDFNFSQPIKSIQKVEFNDKNANYKIDGKTVRVTVPRLNSDTDDNITLTGLESKWFNNQINTVSLEFTPYYIPYDQLSKEEQQVSINKSNSGQINDKFLKNQFPVITDNYKMEVSNLGDSKTIVVTITFFDEIPNYDKGGEVSQLSDKKAEKLRTKVFDKIRKLGGTPDKYLIYYSNNYLTDKYSKQLD